MQSNSSSSSSQRSSSASLSGTSSCPSRASSAGSDEEQDEQGEEEEKVKDDHRPQAGMQPQSARLGRQIDSTSGNRGDNNKANYRNSPFGLTNHYLSMPEEEEDSRLEGGGRQTKTAAIPKSGVRKLTSSEADWPTEYNTMAHGLGMLGAATTIQPEPLDFNPDDQVHSDGLPAGDAGLDAGKCNAKDIEKYKKANQRESSNTKLYHHQIANNLHFSPIHDRHHDHNHDDQHRHHHHLDEGLFDDPPGSKLEQTTPVEANSNERASTSLLVRFGSIMYATFLVILGCIFHISELRQKSKNSSDHIYTTIVALLGMLWLIFLQLDLHRYKRYASRYIMIKSLYKDHKQQRRLLELQQARSVLPSSVSSADVRSSSGGSSAASLINDRMSMNTEVIFKKTAYKMYQERAALLSRLHEHPASLIEGSKSHYQVRKRHKLAAGGLNAQDELAKRNLEPAYKFLHGKMGANFYLKCGMAAFCFGHVIHEGLRFGQQVYFFSTNNVHCRDLAALVAHCVTPLYSFYQLFMMFKYSNLVINRHKVLAKFGLMHIIGTSVTFWFRTIMEEAFEDFVHKMDYFKTNKLHSSSSSAFDGLLGHQAGDKAIASNLSATSSILTLMSSPMSDTMTPQIARHLPDSYACAQNTLLTTKSMNALPYLYPFTIEYNLLLAATFLSLYFNIGKVGLRGSGHKSCQSISLNCQDASSSSGVSYSPTSGRLKMATDKLAHGSSRGSFSIEQHSTTNSSSRAQDEKSSELGEYKSNFVVNADCHSANKGLFCGFFVLLVTLVTIVIFFVTINKPSHVQLGIKINLIQEATLTTLILIVMAVALKQVSKLSRNPNLREKVTTDDVLILIPLPFFFIHSLLSFRAETASLMAIKLDNSLHLASSNLFDHQTEHSAQNGLDLSKSLGASGSETSIRTIVSKPVLRELLLGHSANSGDDINDQDHHDDTSDLKGQASNHRNSSRASLVGSAARGNNDAAKLTLNFSQIDPFKLITVALNIVVMVEVLVQTNFIIDGMRRCSESRYLRFKKPGRELITFAILLNITYWIVATFETKSVEQYKTEIEYYGPLPYMFISHTTLPVMLFYRYHSSVCLTEIWNRAYKPPKKLQ